MAKFPCLRMSSWRTDWQTNIDKRLGILTGLRSLAVLLQSHEMIFHLDLNLSMQKRNVVGACKHWKLWLSLQMMRTPPRMLYASCSFLACHHVGTVDSMSQDYISGCSWWHPHLGLPHTTYNLPNRIRSASGMENYATAETLLGL